MASSGWESPEETTPPPPGWLPPPPAGLHGSEPVDSGDSAWWKTLLGGLGWVVTFAAILTTSQLLIRLGLEAVGLETTPVGPTGGDEKNPPGQYIALVSAIAIGVWGTYMLRRWYRADPSAAPSLPLPPERESGDAAETRG